jgi:hypothetical protein
MIGLAVLNLSAFVYLKCLGDQPLLAPLITRIKKIVLMKN